MFKEITQNKFPIALLYIISTLLVILEAYLGFLTYGQTYLGVYTSTRPTVLINSMAAIPLLFIVAQIVKKSSIAAKFFTAASKYSYGVFFVHPQILTVVKKLVGLRYGTYTTRIFHLHILFKTYRYLFLYILLYRG